MRQQERPIAGIVVLVVLTRNTLQWLFEPLFSKPSPQPLFFNYFIYFSLEVQFSNVALKTWIYRSNFGFFSIFFFLKISFFKCCNKLSFFLKFSFSFPFFLWNLFKIPKHIPFIFMTCFLKRFQRRNGSSSMWKWYLSFCLLFHKKFKNESSNSFTKTYYFIVFSFYLQKVFS